MAGNVALSGRVDVTPIPGVFGGIGFYNGGSGQEQVRTEAGDALDVGTTIVEAHVQGQLRGFDVRGLFARADVDDAGDLTLQLRRASTVPLAQTGQHRKRAVVLISDGNDTDSQVSLPEVKQMIRESEVMVYAVGIDGQAEDVDEGVGPVLGQRPEADGHVVVLQVALSRLVTHRAVQRMIDQ